MNIEGLLKKFKVWMTEQIFNKAICHHDHRWCMPDSERRENGILVCRQCFDKYMEGIDEH